MHGHRSRFAELFAALSLCFALLLCAANARAQATNGQISGSVQDAAGSVLPNTTVTVTNVATNLTREATTNDEGFYSIANLPPGDYSVTAEQTGFAKLTQTGHTLVADGRLSVDFALETGNVAETVEVTGAVGETVNTTSGEIARVVDQKQVQNLALNGRNFIQLATLIPGSALLSDNQLELTTTLNVNGAQSVNGNRTNSTNITVDGGNNLDSGSNNSIVNNVGIDFIQEVKIQTSNFSAEYGRTSGASINLVTRSGTNEYHGSLFEFVRNDKLDARNFFAPRRGTLRFNDFGYAVGGPVRIPKIYNGKDKFFFFGGMEWKYIRQQVGPSLTTLPTTAERRGDFSLRLRGPDGVVGTNDDGVLRDPNNATATCVAPRIVGGIVTQAAIRTGCFGGENVAARNIIPTARITTDGRAIANVYSLAQTFATAYTDSPIGNNTTFQQPNPFNFRQDILRLDYRFNESHSLTGRYLHDVFDLIEPFGTFIGGALPTIPTNRLRPGWGVQTTHTWVINPRLVNEAKINTSWNGQRIPPVGDTWIRDTYGFAYPQVFSGGGRFDNSIPDTTVAGFGGFNGAARALVSPTTDIALIDNLTISAGNHSIRLGGIYTRNRKDQNGRPTYAGNLNFSVDGNTNTTGQSFADALLGNFRTYSEFAADPVGFFRFSQFEAYVSDNWKINRKLSLELGARYLYHQPIYTQANNIINFDPSLYDPARAVFVRANSTIDPASIAAGANRFNGLIRAGDGIPQSDIGRVPNADSPDLNRLPLGAPRGLYETQHKLAPRVSFAFSPFEDSTTAIRGGFGMFFDRPEGNIIYDQINVAPFVQNVQYENFNLSNPGGGTASALAPFGTLNAINPQLDIPYTMNFSLSVQRELPRGVFAEIAYVGNLGRHLIRRPDINQPTFEVLAANAALPAAQRRSVNALRPYQGYSVIQMRLSDSTSNYHALQVYVAKRRGDLLLTSSYTFGKVLTDSSANDSGQEDPFNRRFNYGPATFDRRHVSVTTYTYTLPFFRGARGFRGALLSGYEISGITRFQTGGYFTPTGNTSIGGRRADYVGGEVSLPDGERSIRAFYNTAAFRQAPDSRRGNAGVGIIQGPGRQSWDISLRKRFAFNETRSLELRAELFNAFNRANFLGNQGFSGGALNTTRNLAAGQTIETANINLADPLLFTDAAFGSINSAGTPRNVQLAVKFLF